MRQIIIFRIVLITITMSILKIVTMTILITLNIMAIIVILAIDK